jgi:ribonuclease-3
MRLGKGEEMAGGRKREALLADGLEAVIGAAYLDGGVKAAEKIVATLLIPLLGETLSDDWMANPKGKLQELSQGLYSCGPEYKCISEEGPAHRKVFVVEAIVGGARLGQGSGPSKRVAETEAAIVGVRKLLAGK